MSKLSTEKLRQKYIQNPPEGMTADEIRTMSEEDLLDMDYFLNEEDFDFGEAVNKVFTSSNKHRLLRMPAFQQAFFQRFSGRRTFL